VLEGGHTSFTKLDISVQPKKGGALVWPSVLNEDPSESDPRMYHEARPVTKGIKFAANHWIHQYDSKNENLWGCSGGFA
jgi:prolyl 4-hydroxylase